MAHDNQYTKSFETFLAHTDEKRVLVENITTYLAECKPSSLLDIGAGNGVVAKEIAKLVPKYIAVEQQQKYVQNLRDAGLQVIPASFPVYIKEQFDFVLLSHIVSYEQGDHAKVLKAALRLVADRGNLLMITHRGEPDDWSKLLQSLGMEQKIRKYSEIYSEIIHILCMNGSLRKRRVVTTIEASNVSDMIRALSFVASNGKRDRFETFWSHKDTLVKILDTHYKKDGVYSFPFHHIFLLLHKG